MGLRRGQCSLNAPSPEEAASYFLASDASFAFPFAQRLCHPVVLKLRGVFMWGVSPVASMAGRRRERFLGAPTEIHDSLPQRRVTDTGIFRPFRPSLGLAVEGNHRAVAAVSVLRFAGGPSAVLRRIMAIVINAVERVPGRGAWPHVAKKALERIPALANFDAPASVMRECLTSWAPASIVHIHPCPMFRRAGLAMAKRAASLARLLDAALLGVTHLRSLSHLLMTAVASTKPKTLMLISGRRYCHRDDSPFAEALSSQIKRLTHEVVPVRVANLKTIQEGTLRWAK